MTEAEGFPEGLHPTLVANCAVNAFFSFTAILLNVITIQALRKTASLSKTLKTLLLSLSIGIIGSVCLIIAGALYCKMHAVVRRHRNEINRSLQVQQVAQNGKLASDAKLKKTALATFYVLSCFWDVMCHTFA